MERLDRPLGNRGEEEEENRVNPFARSSKLRRTPPSTPTPCKEEEHHGTEEVQSKEGGSGGNKAGAETSRGGQADVCLPDERKSPVSTKVEKCQREEDEQLKRCGNILKKMSAAVGRQKNVSIDIKKGLIELEDALNTIEHLRKTWRAAGKHLLRQAVDNQGANPESSGGGKKRVASSPVEQETGKKKKETAPREERLGSSVSTPEQWVKVQKRQQKKRKEIVEQVEVAAKSKEPAVNKKANKGAPKIRRTAIAIAPGEGKSYAQVLRSIKEKITPEDVGAEIKAIRQTRKGHVLLELGNKDCDPSKLSSALVTALGDAGVVRSLVPKTTVEIRDLDCLTERDDVEEALKRDLQDIGEATISLTATNARGQRTAIVEMGDKEAAKLIKQGKIKISWVNCRVRRRAVVQRCYKCLEYGHLAKNCRGPDRSHLCFRCGQAGHKWKECTASARCTLCYDMGLDPSELAHVPGTGQCKAFRVALEKARKLVR